MEEKNIVKKENEVVNTSNNSNNKNGIIAVLVVIIIALIGAVVYFAFIKKDDTPVDNKGGNNQQENDNTSDGKNEVMLSSDEAITIAKEKLDEANTNKLIGDTCFDGNEEYSEEGNGSLFCYYGTLETFKNKFYNVYSSKLDYKDVLVEYNVESGKSLANFSLDGDISGLPNYTVKDSKVYTNGCTIGTGSYNRMDKFNVDSISVDTIKINYVVIGNSNPDVPDESKEYEYSRATAILVKENGDWKILKATIVDMCNGVYEVGK